MRVTVKKRGNRAFVRMPASITLAAKLRVGQIVDIREECGRIVIAPLRIPAFDLDDLIAGITAENRHA